MTRRVGNVALVHDYLTQRGGAERVVLSLLKAFPSSTLFASFYEPANTFPEFGNYEVVTSGLNRWPFLRKDPRRAAALLPLAMRSFDLRSYELVVCSSSGWAHLVASDAPRIVYCYTPPRWLYEPTSYFSGAPSLVRGSFEMVRKPLTWWDRRSARQASRYVAISNVVAARIERAYNIVPSIIHPAPALGPGSQLQIPGSSLDAEYFLTVSRARGYKRTSAIIEAASQLQVPLIVVGGGNYGELPTNIRQMSDLNDAQLSWLYSNCRALIAAANEDFGLTPLEAAAFGKPSIVLRSGGYLDTVIEGVTGVYFDEPTPDSIVDAILRSAKVSFDSDRICSHSETFSEARFIAEIQELSDSVVAS